MGNKRILIVDDEEPIGLLLSRIVSGAHPDFEIKTVKDGATALERFQRQAFDLMFVDYQMPQMNGLQLAKTIQKISPDTRNVLMSGSNIERISLNDLDGFISKPFSVAQVLNVVEHIMV